MPSGSFEPIFSSATSPAISLAPSATLPFAFPAPEKPNIPIHSCETRRVPRPFAQVDVLGSGPCSGNPVAVVLGAEGLEAEEMQRFARWTNLAETTFVLPPTRPEADYRVRIFTPVLELPFAGHPTLGTCHAWLEAGGEAGGEEIVQECEAGLVRVRREGERRAFPAPPLVRSGPAGGEERAK